MLKGLPMARRFTLPHVLATAVGLVAMVSGPSAYAGDGGGWRNGSWYGDEAPPLPSSRSDDMRTMPAPAPRPAIQEPAFDREARRPEPRLAQPGREAWLADCRNRVASRDNGVGGAVIGGVVGGVAGNRIAGRGNRTIGTLGGAAVGAIAGSAIDRAEDRGRATDECEAYLDDYYARYAAGGYGSVGQPGYSQAYVQPGYVQTYGAYGYAGAPCCGGAPMMVPVQPAPQCTETIEYIYEDVPAPRRSYRPAPRRTKIVPDKRIKIVPDKRVSTK